jgi:hypothetical protein
MKNNNMKNWKVIHEESSKWARWIALYEAVNYIADKAEDKKISFSKIDLPPLAIMKYITATEDIILRKILKHEHNIDICCNEDASIKYNSLVPDFKEDY